MLGLVGLTPKTVGCWARDFEATTYIAESQRGKHSKTPSPMNNPAFREELKSYVKEHSRKSGCKIKIYNICC